MTNRIFNCCSPRLNFLQRIGSALFYAACSALITVINKVVLTSYKFPSFQLLAIGQLCISIFALLLVKSFGFINLPSISRENIRKVMPLPLLFFGNLSFGLGGTQALNLPMFTVLRRFSIWMTMIGERLILRQTQSTSAQISVYLMILGALIAAGDDLTFNLFGYSFIMLNNICTATQGVVIKQKMINEEFSHNGLLYLNSLIIFIPAIALALITDDFEKIYDFDQYHDIGFILSFLLSSFLGFLLNYSSLLCTKFNSPLTTTVVGACKNLFITYIGMLIGGDYIYSHLNFLGLNVSVFGSLFYTWVTFSRKPTSSTTNPHLPLSSNSHRKGNQFEVNESVQSLGFSNEISVK